MSDRVTNAVIFIMLCWLAIAPVRAQTPEEATTLDLLGQHGTGGAVSQAITMQGPVGTGTTVPENDPLPWGRSDLVLRGRALPGMTIQATVWYRALTWLPIGDTTQIIQGTVDEASGTYRLHVPAIRDRLVMRDIIGGELKILVPDPSGEGRIVYVRSLTSTPSLLPDSVPFSEARTLRLGRRGSRGAVVRIDGERIEDRDYTFLHLTAGRPGNHRLDVELDGATASELP